MKFEVWREADVAFLEEEEEWWHELNLQHKWQGNQVGFIFETYLFVCLLIWSCKLNDWEASTRTLHHAFPRTPKKV